MSSSAYDAAGAERGNSHKITKELACLRRGRPCRLDFLADHPSCTGKLGSIGICIGGHLSFRAAFNPDVRAAACFYATDIHKRGLGQGMNDDSLDRVGEIGGEVLMIWGRQDPHIPREGRERIHAALEDAGTRFSWVEVNGQHAFGRDEGPATTPSSRASASDTCWICSTAGLGRATRKWPLTAGRSRPVTERSARTSRFPYARQAKRSLRSFDEFDTHSVPSATAALPGPWIAARSTTRFVGCSTSHVASQDRGECTVNQRAHVGAAICCLPFLDRHPKALLRLRLPWREFPGPARSREADRQGPLPLRVQEIACSGAGADGARAYGTPVLVARVGVPGPGRRRPRDLSTTAWHKAATAGSSSGRASRCSASSGRYAGQKTISSLVAK